VLNLVAADWESLFAAPEDAPPPEALLLACVRRFVRPADPEPVIRSARIEEAVRMPGAGSAAYLNLIRAEHAEEARTYFVPLAGDGGDQAERLIAAEPGSIIARIAGASPAVLHDPLVHPPFLQALIEAMAAGRSFAGKSGSIKAWAAAGQELHGLLADRGSPVTIHASEPHNTVVRCGEFVFKVFRRLEEGINPELEIGRFLTEKGFPHAARLAGAIEYRGRKTEPVTLAVLERHVPNEGDAWQYTLDDLSGYYERAAAWRSAGEALPAPRGSVVDAAAGETPAPVHALVDTYLESARQMGRRTAELHLALSSDTRDAAFAPEPFSPHYQRSIYQSMRNLSGPAFALLRQMRGELPEDVQGIAARVLEREGTALERFRTIVDQRITALRTRYHGDYHLGQLLRTGKDFVIIDFEGNPARSLGDRRAKRSPLRDVAAMIRSFHYAAHSVLFGLATPRGRPPGVIRPEDVPVLEPWARFWCHWVGAAFLRAYLEAAGEAAFLPRSRPEMAALFTAIHLEKAVFELGSELQTRLAWARIPMLGILQILDEGNGEERGPALLRQ
jgi:maltose alpha-D-glucosyltransferase/alpha-amylase